jgi:cell division septation protein DedD
MVDQQEEEDHSSRTTATLKPTKVKSTSKRPKTEQRMSEEQQAEPEPASQTSQASSQKKGNFVVSSPPSTWKIPFRTRCIDSWVI